MKTLHTIYTNFAKRLVVLLMVLMTIGIGNMLAEQYTYVFSTTDNWYTTSNKTTKVGTGNSNNYTAIYYSDNTEWTASGTSHYFNSGYYLLGKSGACLNVPTFNDEKITSIQIFNSSGCSKNVSVAIISGNQTAANAQTWSTTSRNYTYSISSNYQSSSLAIKVSNSYNAQITKVIINTESVAPACSYTVTFNGNGNTDGSMDNQTFTCDVAQELTANSFSRTGYTFVGWNTEADGSGDSYTNQESVNLSSINNDNITLYAQWTPTQYTITYNGLEGATHSNPTNYTIESETITFTAPSERIGYNFTGWNPASIAKGSTGNKTVTAQWTEKSLTNYRTSCSTETLDCVLLQFNTNIDNDYSATYLQNATADDLTVSAQYNGNSTGVTYQWYSNNTNSNTSGTPIADATNASYTPSTSTEGTIYYYCVATYKECTITSNVATIVVNPTCTVTFDSDGGSEVTPQTIEKGKTATKPTDPTKTGYTFESWFYEGSEFDFNTPITENITLTAQWIINKHIVTLDPNYPDGKTGTFKDKDGNTISGDLVLTYDYGTASMSLTDLYQSIELEGYRFDGWYNAKGVNPGEVSGAKCSVTNTIERDLTFYAKWTKVDCRWIETDIANILPEDEVVITMLKDGHLYALDHSNGDTNYPPATEIFVSGNKIESVVGDAIQWNITGDATNGYTIYPNGTTDTWLFCSKSYVRVGDNSNNVFTIENGYLKRTNLEELWAKYIGVSISTSSWRHYDNTTGVIVNQTLKFYKRVCVDESNPWYTVTFNAGSGSCNTESLTGTKNEGITLPTATPSDACVTDGWIFAGWAEASVTETEKAPTLFSAGDKYYPANNCPLYAVYSYTKAGGSGSTDYVLTNIGDIADDDIVVITMKYTDGTVYALSSSNGSIDTPPAPTVTVSDNKLSDEPADTLKWNISNSSGTLTIYPNGTTAEWLYCTSSNDGVRIGTNDNKEFTIDASSGYLKNTNTNRYVGVYRTNPDWRCYTNTTGNTANQTLGFYVKSSGGSTTTYDSNPSCEACENILTISKGEETNENTFTLTPPSGDIETCDGDVEVLVNPTPAEHYSVSEVTATTPTTGGTPTITNNGDGTWTVTYTQNSTGESTINVTFVQDAKASITLSELGEETTDNTTYYVGEQYTLPTTSSQSCDGKQLVGWSTVEVAETDTKPTENYYELGAEVTLAATQTFYAVFATAGEGGGGNGIVFKETFDTNEGTGGNDSQWGGTIASSDISSDHTWVFCNAKGAFKCAKFASNSSGGSATTPAIDCSGSANATLTFKAGSWKGDETTLNIESTNCTVDLTSVDLPDQTWGEYIVNITSITGEITITFSSNLKNRFFLDEVEITTSGGVSYTGYTTSCVPTYSITYDFAGGIGSHCSNTSVPQGDTYTICDEAPSKEGHTFLGWSDGTTTYAAGATITPTKNTTLTAQWQINTYTVIWSNNGATDTVTYNHGESLVVPTDIASCDGVKEFVGWTEDNTFTYHATTPPSDIFTEKTATVTADATYYAVFATPPGTGGGGGGSETTTTLDFTAQGYANETAISNLTVDGVTATFDKGSNSNAPKYYTNGTAIRAYGGNTITLSANQITAATFTFGGSDGSNDITADCGSWESPTWTGDATDEVVFTIDGTSGNRRIQSIAVTCTSGGGSGSYSDYTTICQQIESIEVQNPQTEFYLTDNFTIGEGKVIATLSGGGTADVTALATFSGYDMEKVGTYTVTVTYMGATATYNINVKPLDNAWVLTWNVSGKTNTGLGPRTVNKGSAIGTLPVPEVPAACEGKTFMGWTESNTVPSDGIGIVYITPETVPTDNTTYYAVFATVNNFCTQKPIEDIVSGSKVVVVAVASLTADGGSGKAISSRATDDTYNLQGDSVVIYDETINTPHSTCIWTITKKDGKYVLTQDGKYLNGVLDGMYSNLKYLNTEDSWTLTPAKSGMTMTYNMESTNASGEYIEWYRGKFAIHHEVNDNGDFDMQFYVTLGDGADITDYTTGCEEYTITYYGFRGGYSTSSSSDGIIVLPVNSKHTVPDCGDVVKDHTNLGREFLNLWMTQPHGGQTFKPGDTFILTQDTTLYAQWELNTTTDVTLPTGVEDLAGTDVYVYGGNTLTMVPDIVTINSLTLKGGLQPDGSYQMPNVWIPDGATLVRNTNKIYLDLAINAKNWYPFAVPFATKNDQYLDYLDPVLRGASTYGKHFAIRTYDGARRAEVGEDRANNWTQLKRHTGGTTSYLEPGVGYIISAMTYPDKDTATIRIPMTVPNTWFENGEQTVVGSTSRNTIAVTAHTGAAATEHRRHAGWNFIASPYLSEFAGNKVDNDGTYINGWINIANQYNYEDTEIPYVTIPVYDFAYYEQKKVSEATLSPEWSFFVQIAVDGTIDFVEEGRQTVPAGIAARTQEERSVKMDIDINLTDGRNTDQMGIIVCEKYSDAYEIGRDLEKMFGSAYNLVVYSLMNDNTPLAYQAVPILNETHAIPIGYRAPEQGEYTFSLKQNTSSIDLLNEQYEQLVLVDYEKGALTNLLNSDYTFSSERTQSNSRFALYAVPRQDSSTELPNISDEEDAIRKIFYNGHLFIIRNGNVYNGNGQIVK